MKKALILLFIVTLFSILLAEDKLFCTKGFKIVCLDLNFPSCFCAIENVNVPSVIVMSCQNNNNKCQACSGGPHSLKCSCEPCP